MDVYSELASRGVAKAVVRFSGGNDEGGPDAFDLYNADEQRVGLLDEWNGPKADQDLAEALAAPVYERWGGFAGDFSVYGELTWDVATRSCKMSGEESQYVPFEY